MNHTTKQIKELRRNIARCDQCDGLNVTGETGSCPGVGSVSNVMIINGSLSERAMQDRRPISGKPGALLDKALTAAHTTRKSIYITNVQKCRTDSTGRVRYIEIQHCREYLLSEIRIIRPRLIITLGRMARLAMYLPDTNKQLEYSIGGHSCTFKTFRHPSYYLQNDMTSYAWVKELAQWIERFI